MYTDRECVTKVEELTKPWAFYTDAQEGFIKDTIVKLDQRICAFFDCHLSDLYEAFSVHEIKRLRIKFCS